MKKIVVIGPESTGKTYLSEILAKHFGGVLVAEYAREYLLENNNTYTYEELDTIAKGQLEREEKAVKQIENDQTNMPLIIDTDMQVIMVWSEYVFNTCKSWILQEVASRKYDLFLLCKPDIPWVKDRLREYPDMETREKLYKYYLSVLQEQSAPFVIVEGDYDNRTAVAIEAVASII